jgi:single-strand DNA-binding protein
MGANTWIGVGNLGRDPDLRYTPQGTPVCQFSIATDDRIRKEGQWVKHTTWYRVTVFGKQAEACSQYLTKGRPVHVVGKHRTEEWVDRDGKNRYTNEITADHVYFVGARDDRENNARADSEKEYDQRNRDRAGKERKLEDQTQGGPEPTDLTDDDVPF